MIVGTAGHIDHGKTSLVRALTGVDTDRLKEEKARGITIELGFAYWPRPDGAVVGFVDVPGHERLVHTMLAGASGIDLVLLAVAADDGVMPQTREHLAIVDLLGIRRGLVALTKCDLADAPRRPAVTAEVRAALAGSGLAEAEILPVSTLTGEGLPALAARLDSARMSTVARAADGRFRLAIDRVFALAGAGTVVTGTVLSGTVAVDDRVVVSPAGIEARVRSIHAQNRPAGTGVAGQRCALALVGPKVSRETVTRGQVLLDPALHAPVRRIDAHLTLLPGERRPLGQWTPVRLHHAAAEVPARLVVLEGEALAPGSTGFVQLVLEEPLAAAAGDRFVLRDTAATRTLGGGTLIDLQAPERRRRTPERRAELTALANPDPADALARFLAGGRGWIDLTGFVRDRAAAADLGPRLAARLGLVTLAAGPVTAALLPAAWERFRDALGATLDTFHADNPELPGLSQERLRLALTPRLPAPVFAAALARLRQEGVMTPDRAWVRRPGHEVRFTPEEEALWAGLRPHLAGETRFRPPRVRDLARQHDMEERQVRRLFRMAARRGDVEEIAQDHFFLAATVVEMADAARTLAAAATDGQFAVSAFRDRLDNGRKVAIQILEFFDKQGLTMRRGDIRRINPHKADLFSLPPAESPSVAGETTEEQRPRWGDRTSNPGRAARRSLVGSTPTSSATSTSGASR